MMPDLCELWLELDSFTKSWIFGGSFDTITLDLACWSSIVHQVWEQLL